MPLLLITCGVWDVPFPLELALDPAAEGLLIRFDGQKHVGPLLHAPLKNGRVGDKPVTAVLSLHRGAPQGLAVTHPLTNSLAPPGI